MWSADTEACAYIERLESGPPSMESLLLRLFHWVWKAYWWGFQATKYGFDASAGSKYGLATKYKWDGLTIVIFWKFIDVLDDFHIKLYGDIFWEKSYLL